jgi:transcriptional regulator with XRE-family HTH domain
MKGGNPMAQENQEKQPITVKQLADRAGISPSRLRRILRTRFPRDTKGKLYNWQPDDPQIELILKAVKNHQAEATKPAEATKTEPAKPAETEKPATKPAPKPKAKKAAGNVPAGAKPKNDPFPKPNNGKPIRKTVAELKAEGVTVSQEAVIK